MVAWCSMLRLLCSWPAVVIAGFGDACGMLGFVHGDGVVEVRGVERKRVLVRVDTPRASTLFASAARLLPFATRYSRGAVFRDPSGRGGYNMCFRVPVDAALLEEPGAPWHLLG